MLEIFHEKLYINTEKMVHVLNKSFKNNVKYCGLEVIEDA